MNRARRNFLRFIAAGGRFDRGRWIIGYEWIRGKPKYMSSRGKWGTFCGVRIRCIPEFYAYEVA